MTNMVPMPEGGMSRLMVYDGYCHLCSGWADFMSRHPTDPPFTHLPMQSETGRALLMRHGIDPDDPATFLVVDGERVLTDSDAALHVVTALGGAWRALGLARAIPKPWRDALYRVLARNRYRWFGRRAQCHVPSNDV
jgi:predicted DCC family thiol-disulfide oxidoreductase YuxK